ncbi:MAG: fibronectin type III domain-containing protein, partial [Burkholderiaceae bacterium]|nr:fibronectin type III domain-containing protein [Burkholderiaceae bacterium]
MRKFVALLLAIPASGPGSLTASVVERGTCSGPNVFGAAQESVTVNALAVSYTFTGLAPGTYCFRVKVRNTCNAESDWSAVASKTITPPVPKPPIL